MPVGRRADDDRLDARIRQQLVQISRGDGGAKLVREGPRRHRQPTHDAGEVDVDAQRSLLDAKEGEGVLARDGAVTEDRDLEVHPCPPQAGRGDGATAWGLKSRRRRSCALSATTMVETLIRMAPTAGGRMIPMGASTPAARGMASTL